MPLRSIELASYRGIERGVVTFDDTTFVFGENDSGRASLIEALRLTLGSRGGLLATELRAHHFRRGDSGEVQPLRIRIEVAESGAAEWQLPPRLAAAYRVSEDRPRDLLFDFNATLAADGSIAVHREIQSRDRFSTIIKGDDQSEAWLRSAFPILWLGPGNLTALPAPGLAVGAEPRIPAGGDRLGSDPDIQALIAHQRNLITGTADNLVAEVEAGAEAAGAVLARYPQIFAGAAPMISAMAAEVLDRRSADDGKSGGQATLAEQPAGKIAVLLLATAMIDMADDVLGSGPLPTHAEPVLILENPEANLHPTTIASLWRLVERITWQKVVATHSATILSYAPVTSLRRLTRQGSAMRTWAVGPHTMSRNALRKVDYHLRSRRAPAIFARCWMLVEGETEFWVLPELARVLGYDLPSEGVACVEFAQSGPQPLLRVATQFGIGCHVLADGDHAGEGYRDVAVKFAPGIPPAQVAVTTLDEPDIEHCFWDHGFSDVITRVANLLTDVDGRSPTSVIHHAIDRTSKPYLALALVEAAAGRGPSSVPPSLRAVVESAVQIARFSAG